MRYLGVKLCGNCNPRIDGYALAKSLAAELELELLPWDDPRTEALLVVNGCDVGCIQRPALFHINGLSLERDAYPDEAALRAAVLLRLRQALNHHDP